MLTKLMKDHLDQNSDEVTHKLVKFKFFKCVVKITLDAVTDKL